MLRQAGVSGHAYPVGVHQPRLLVHPWPRSLAASPPTFFKISISRGGGGGEREEKISSEIPLDSSASLSLSLSPDTPPFSLVSFSGFGRRETDTNPLSAFSLFGLSPSWFRWNLIWIAAFGFGHSCTATVGKEEEEGKKKQDWTLKAPNLIKSGARCAPSHKTLRCSRQLDAPKRA